MEPDLGLTSAPAVEEAPLEPREFCALQRELVNGMTMRKKRKIAMGPVQELKVRLLDRLEALGPPPERFAESVARVVHESDDGQATGPAQAVASDLLMDWQMACASPRYVAWLREAARRRPAETQH